MSWTFDSSVVTFDSSLYTFDGGVRQLAGVGTGVKLAQQSFHWINAISSGNLDGRYPDGNDLSGGLSWKSLPELQNILTNTGYTLNLRSFFNDLSSPTSTFSIYPGYTPATGFSLSGDNWTQAGSSTGAGTIRFRATRLGVTVDTAVLPYSSISSLTAGDTLAPPIVTGLIVSPGIGVNNLQWDPSCDPNDGVHVSSGLQNYDVLVAASVVGTPASPAVGLSLLPSQGTVGSLGTGSGSQTSGFDWSVSADGAIAGAADNYYGVGDFSVTGDCVMTVLINAVSGSTPGVAPQMGLMARVSQAQNSQFVMATLFGDSSPAPFILRTDIVSGSTTGGANNNGRYLSIYGWNFGTTGLGSTVKVFLGGAEVAAYLELGQSVLFPKNGLQRIRVQLGALGGAAAGAVLAVQVTVNGIGSNTDHTFTVQVGDTYFVSATGNDATGVKNDITHPYRYLQAWNGSSFTGVWSTIQAGDQIVLRGGLYADNNGFDSRWMRWKSGHTGSAPTGAVGHGDVHITAYPGETVQFNDPPGGGGGIQGCGTADASGGAGKYCSVSCLHIALNATSIGDAGGINLQSSADNWRVIDNECGPWPSTITGANHARSAGIAGNGHNMAIQGNYCHDINGDHSANENHTMYFDGSNSCTQNSDISGNWCLNALSGSCLQFYNSSASDTFVGNKVHDNYLDGAVKYGINIADSNASGDFYNNIITNTQKYGIRFNTNQATAINVVLNTVYNCMQDGTGSNTAVQDEWTGGANVVLMHNLIVLGPNTASGAGFMGLSGETVNRNLFFDTKGVQTTGVGSNPIVGNPLFVNPAAGNFNVVVGSPAINTANQTMPISVTKDFFSLVRPFPGKAFPTIGAVETTV
jgi:hypothetical protein